ncbi:glycosyl transferase [Mesorhizobium sp. LSHC420B00]|uniref:exopolysaccharide biosynthesis polyprenyl glycosylphosphotransferase n=1 Tax=unclassified Mesorhizobium TaxID=325217 RepID=UPI0003CE88C2|nr:exopolysaccharide biosynthesis polyprenyl glycosylphosphotransferase [Mesorhizobium sp. LSHC420B00]ESX65420.1 glycosyl transferase [Mesorhizobium sp. LSHC420B00]
MTEIIQTIPKKSVVYGRAAFHFPQALLVGVCMVADFVIVGLSVHAVILFYQPHILYDLRDPHVLMVTSLAATFFVVFESLSGAYTTGLYLEPMASARNALLSWLMVAFVFAWIGVLVETIGELSHELLITSFAVGAAAIVLVRVGTVKALRVWLGRGAIAIRRAHLICFGDQASAEVLSEAQNRGIQIVGVSILPADKVTGRAFARMCEDLVRELRDALQRVPFDEIYLFFPWDKRLQLRNLATALGRLPLPVFLFADAAMERLLQTSALRFGPFKGFELQRAPLSWAERAMKRSLDVSIALAGLVLLAPLLIAVSIAIRATSGSPVIFRQERQGLCGRRFQIYKFRTMRVCEDGPTIAQATADDPRVTPFGSLLRRTSIDELPQLLNVLRGEMSIVGPRPHAVAHDEYYSALIAFYARRQNVKPGLTGWAQINGFRGETRELNAMAARVNHDLWYINNWSIWLDIYLICRTAVKILTDRKAH